MAHNRATAKKQLPVAIKKVDMEDDNKKQAASPVPSMIGSSGAASSVLLPPAAPEETRRGSVADGESVVSSSGSFFDVDTKEQVSIEDTIDETGVVDETADGAKNDEDLQWWHI